VEPSKKVCDVRTAERKRSDSKIIILAALFLALLAWCAPALAADSQAGEIGGASSVSAVTNAQSIMSPPFSAACDDSTDDTAAIQAALDAAGGWNGSSCATNGGAVYKPAGKVCKVTSTLTIHCPNIVLYSNDTRQFITNTVPSGYIDCQVSNADCINVGNNQGWRMENIGLKYPSATGASLGTPSAPTLGATSGGSLTNQTYHVMVSCTRTNAGAATGETLLSSEATLNPNPSMAIAVTAPTCGTGATGWNVYASTNANNERLQNTTPNTLGVKYTLNSVANNGLPNFVDTTPNCAILDTGAAGYYQNVSVQTPSLSNGPYGTPDGICFTGGNFHITGKSHVEGFNRAFVGTQLSGHQIIEQTNVMANNYGAVINGPSNLTISHNDFEDVQNGAIDVISGSQISIDHNYGEQDNFGGTNSYMLTLGTTGALYTNAYARPLQAVDYHANFLNCNGYSAQDPIVINWAAGLNIAGNAFSNCGSQAHIINNAYATSTAGIRVLGNISDATTTWYDSLTGFVDYDFSSTAGSLGARTMGALTAGNLTDSALTSGNCVQASTNGLLTTTSGACGSSTAKSWLVSNAGANLSTTNATTQMMPMSGTGNPTATGNEGSLYITTVPQSGTLKNLHCQVASNAAPGASNSYTITVRKNKANAGSPGSISCAISGGSSTQCTDTTNTLAVSAYDSLDYFILTTVGGSAISTASSLGCGIELDS
jgi:hypothetical protein